MAITGSVGTVSVLVATALHGFVSAAQTELDSKYRFVQVMNQLADTNNISGHPLHSDYHLLSVLRNDSTKRLAESKNETKVDKGRKNAWLDKNSLPEDKYWSLRVEKKV